MLDKVPPRTKREIVPPPYIIMQLCMYLCVYLFVMLRTHKDNIIISLLALPCEQTHVYHLFGYTHLAQTHFILHC